MGANPDNFEIYEGDDGRRFLVFQLSAQRASLAIDDEEGQLTELKLLITSEFDLDPELLSQSSSMLSS